MVVRPGRRDTSVWWPARQVGGLAWPCPSWGAWVLGGLVVWCGVLSEWCSVLGIMLLLLPWQSIQGAGSPIAGDFWSRLLDCRAGS